jgi:hypothetical protein
LESLYHFILKTNSKGETQTIEYALEKGDITEEEAYEQGRKLFF